MTAHSIEPGHSYVFIIIPVGKQLQANNYADAINESKPKNTGNEKTFSVPLWPLSADTETDPPTHYWCCWWMSDKEQQRVQTCALDLEAKVYDSSVWTGAKVLADRKLKTKDIMIGVSQLSGK